MRVGDFLKPGTAAATGLQAAKPLLDTVAGLLGPVGLFTNFAEIVILSLVRAIVVLASFGRTAFMVERVFGYSITRSSSRGLVLGR